MQTECSTQTAEVKAAFLSRLEDDVIKAMQERVAAGQCALAAYPIAFREVVRTLTHRPWTGPDAAIEKECLEGLLSAMTLRGEEYEAKGEGDMEAFGRAILDEFNHQGRVLHVQMQEAA